MKNKYYTPSIEEFRVGFKYELKDLNVYRKDKYDGSQVLKSKSYYDDHGCEYDAIEDDLKLPNYIRVKYLDKQDIESLGFSYCKTHPGMEQMEFDKGEYELTYDPNFKGKQWLRINLEGEGDVTLFSGSIKNLSELKILLKQLNIK